MSIGINDEYLKHGVFNDLKHYSEFYRSLSDSVMNWISMGTSSIINIDTYVFTSIHGTIESIHDVLIKGRINDSYALLRKYYDSVIINLYSNLILKDKFSIENFIVQEIDGWLKGSKTMPSFEKMSKYILASSKLVEMNNLLYNGCKFKGSRFEEIRERCNQHTHYLFYDNLLLNDNEILNTKRPIAMDTFKNDILEIFTMHLFVLFYLNDHYMMSSDYQDSIDIGVPPVEGSQYEVAPFIQEIFDDCLKLKSSEAVNLIKNSSSMRLN
jgi:hypothetical protein